MTPAQEAAVKVLSVHTEGKSKECGFCCDPYPCPEVIVAREVLAQAERTCGTCARFESDGRLHICHRWKGERVVVQGPDDGCRGGYEPRETGKEA